VAVAGVVLSTGGAGVFEYQEAGLVTSVRPESGPRAGGNVLTVEGVELGGADAAAAAALTALYALAAVS
jgi:hypothetical protein